MREIEQLQTLIENALEDYLSALLADRNVVSREEAREIRARLTVKTWLYYQTPESRSSIL